MYSMYLITSRLVGNAEFPPPFSKVITKFGINWHNSWFSSIICVEYILYLWMYGKTTNWKICRPTNLQRFRGSARKDQQCLMLCGAQCFNDVLEAFRQSMQKMGPDVVAHNIWEIRHKGNGPLGISGRGLTLVSMKWGLKTPLCFRWFIPCSHHPTLRTK